MHVGLVLPRTIPQSTPELAVTAEELGYTSAWHGELWGQNALVELAAAAERTSSIQLGTAIVNVYSRTPAVIAMGAASLHRLAPDRIAIGVGVSTPKAIEDLHGLSFDRPIRRTAETIELVNEFLADDGRVEYDGEIYSTKDFPALESPVPMYNAALGPANRRVTGQLCDGWIPNNIPFSQFESAFETIGDAATDAGRDPRTIDVAPWIHVAVSDDPDTAKDAIRGTVAYYVGASEGYENAVGSAFPDQASAVASAWRAGDREAARESVTDEMVRDLGCAGTPETARSQLREVIEHPVIDHPIVDIPAGLSDSGIVRTMEAVAPSEL